MVKRSENYDFRGAWLQDLGLSVGSEMLGVSPRVCRAAPSLQVQSREPAVASCGPVKAAALTMVQRSAGWESSRLNRAAKAVPFVGGSFSGACGSSTSDSEGRRRQ